MAVATALRGTAGKVLYGALFAAVIPALLWLWARGAAGAVTWPAPRWPIPGTVVFGLGVGLILAGMQALWTHGGGLPMNAFPPARYVVRGAFAIVPHPIYVGFVLACAGASIAAGSASGVWLVTPAAALGCVALVYGYEKHDLEARFGARPPSAWLSLPPDEAAPPTLAMRLAAYLLVIAPWAIAYEAVASVGAARDAVSTALPTERGWPVIEESEAIYASTYLVVLAAPLVARARRDLRALVVSGLLATAIAVPTWLAIPFVAPPRPFEPHGALGRLLAMERAWDTPAAAFPSFHVLWAMIAARAWGSRVPRAVAFAWGIAVAASCVTTGMHTVADVLAGFFVFALVALPERTWRGVLRATERLANSWREWNVGGMRVINHAAYAGVAGFVGVLGMTALLGVGSARAVLVSCFAGLVLAALWAQLVEGASGLSRPYGFYGGLLGTILGALAAPLFGVGVWPMLGALAVVGPWVQAIGRLRCLVQGCCHGRTAPPHLGICYVHPRSRVVRMAGLRGAPVYPTPLFSIVWNALLALMTSRMWLARAPLPLLGGTYLVGMGLGRFVEEAYRGEPQTPVFGRLRLYQWVSIATVAAGAIVTCLPGGAPPEFDPSGTSFAAALAYGFACAFALGVDFPRANARFSRLA